MPYVDGMGYPSLIFQFLTYLEPSFQLPSGTQTLNGYGVFTYM